MILIAQVIFAAVFFIGIPAGIISAIKWNGNLKAEIRRSPPAPRRGRRYLRRDSHAQAYVDGFITAEVLDELGDMFK
jgi:hypothetical protein